MTPQEIKNLQLRFERIVVSPELTTEFRKVYGTDFNMVRACIKSDFIKKEAVELIETLTNGLGFDDEKTISVNTHGSSDGIYVKSVDYQISNYVKRDVIKALETIRANPLIQECEIDGQEIWRNIKLYDSTIDNKHRGFEEFRSDVQRIIIKPSGHTTFKAYSKWSDQFLTFEIELLWDIQLIGRFRLQLTR